MLAAWLGLSVVLLAAVLLVIVRGGGASGSQASLQPRRQGQKGTIVWLMHSYVPNVRAGAEITAHALNQKLLALGWRVIVVLPDFQRDNIDGVECYRFPRAGLLSDERLLGVMRSADVFFCQNYEAQKAIQVLEQFRRPIVFFLHIEREKADVLQQRFGVPVAVVYNSLTQREQNPTIHESTIVRPYIPFGDFRARDRALQDGPVMLLNCNENKGGKVFTELARRMRDVPFVGIRGAYSEQMYGSGANLTYIPLQEDPRPLYERAGVIIMPSRSESWGRVALEAMASGVPVIVSTAHGLREATGGAAAAYCRADDVGCFEREIRRLRGDAGHYSACIGRGRTHIEKLSATDDFAAFERWLIGQLNVWNQRA